MNPNHIDFADDAKSRTFDDSVPTIVTTDTRMHLVSVTELPGAGSRQSVVNTVSPPADALLEVDLPSRSFSQTDVDRLLRKRANARLRQQRCRAKKREATLSHNPRALNNGDSIQCSSEERTATESGKRASKSSKHIASSQPTVVAHFPYPSPHYHYASYAPPGVVYAPHPQYPGGYAGYPPLATEDSSSTHSTAPTVFAGAPFYPPSLAWYPGMSFPPVHSSEAYSLTQESSTNDTDASSSVAGYGSLPYPPVFYGLAPDYSNFSSPVRPVAVSCSTVGDGNATQKEKHCGDAMSSLEQSADEVEEDVILSSNGNSREHKPSPQTEAAIDGILSLRSTSSTDSILSEGVEAAPKKVETASDGDSTEKRKQSTKAVNEMSDRKSKPTTVYVPTPNTALAPNAWPPPPHMMSTIMMMPGPYPMSWPIMGSPHSVAYPSFSAHQPYSPTRDDLAQSKVSSTIHHEGYPESSVATMAVNASDCTLAETDIDTQQIAVAETIEDKVVVI
jgi:hypothetical protein